MLHLWQRDMGDGLMERLQLFAETFGMIAHEQGKPAIPTLDMNLPDLIGSLPVGNGEPILDAWLRGWHKARLLSTQGED